MCGVGCESGKAGWIRFPVLHAYLYAEAQSDLLDKLTSEGFCKANQLQPVRC